MPASDNASIRAVVSAAGGHIALADVPRPTPGPGEALVKVAAISLNRGEVKTAFESAPGTRRGWDFAGTVLEAASNGTGPAVGTRVVGIAPVGGWAELLAVNPVFIAPLPDTISFETAAALPVAGLTAHHCLAKGPQQAGRRVLITGASGGVGVFAIQLAAISGAEVTAAIRNGANEALVRRLGAHHVTIGETLAADIGPFDLVLDSVGGRTLGTALGLLAPGGTCVTLGGSEGAVTEFDVSKFRGAGGTSLYGFAGTWELQRQLPSVGLAHLAGLVAEGKLDPMIERRAPLSQIDAIAHDLMDRKFVGKAVIAFEG
jgi:NADPH:quinone reductase-like Zn-dependent oxidoreductase